MKINLRKIKDWIISKFNRRNNRYSNPLIVANNFERFNIFDETGILKGMLFILYMNDVNSDTPTTFQYELNLPGISSIENSQKILFNINQVLDDGTWYACIDCKDKTLYLISGNDVLTAINGGWVSCTISGVQYDKEDVTEAVSIYVQETLNKLESVKK